MKVSKLSSLALVSLMIVSAFAIFAPKTYAQTTMEVVDSLDGDNILYFNPGNYGDEFVVNITVTDVTDMATWQAKITWDPTKLEYVLASRPADHVFAGHTDIPAGPIVESGAVTYGATLLDASTWTFTGSGILFQLRLKIILAPDIMNPLITDVIGISAPGVDSFLLDSLGHDLVFTPVNGDYENAYAIPPQPNIYLQPAVIKPDNMGDVFGVDVMLSNVNSGWSLIGFQFSLMWDIEFIEPAAPYYANGTFLEGFEYYADGVLYLADINVHNRPLPLSPIPDNYNYSMFAAILLPDNPPADLYHAPFPSGSGKLMTVYFKAINETIAPIEAWTWIEFITFGVTEDTYAIDKNLHVVPFETVTNAHYRMPMKSLGLNIDVYTQYPSPYGGQGANMTSDSFGPQDEVCLFAEVTYNDYPVQQKLVGFEIWHEGATGTYHFAREGTTNVDGIANICFRLPWPCVDPVGEIFGWWYVNATVEVAGQVVVDNLKFWVWWPVEVVSIEPKFTTVTQSKQGTEMCFEMIYRRFDVIPLDALLTATVYDELGFFIGSAYSYVTDFGATGDIDLVTGEPIPVYGNWTFCILIPSNAVVGACTVYGNAFTDWPWYGGVPYCPEVTNTLDFRIVAP